MFEIYLWIICFISIYVSIFWINVISLGEEPKLPKLVNKPLVTIAIAAYNEEEGIINTIKSLLNLKYPKEKLEIIVVNDGSKDNTKSLVENFIKDYKNIKLINHEINKGKGAGLNTALNEAKGKYFGVFDADSIADPVSLKVMLPYFQGDNIAAVISPIKVLKPKTTIEKIQRLEYIFATFVRKLMSNIGTLHTTPGVLSLYNIQTIKKIGGFDEKTLTEDYEIALRLKYHNYNIKMCAECENYTIVPQNFNSLWKQRVRWFRGFIDGAYKYRTMILNKKYGLMGLFQVPLNILTLFLVLSSLLFFTYQFYKYLLRFLYRIPLISINDFLNYNFPPLTEILLSINVKMLFPVTISFFMGIYLYFKAHSYIDEKWRFHFASLVYLFIYPLFRSLQWLHAFTLEITKAKRKW